MASTINANTSGGLISTADTSGVLQLQTASVTAVTIDASRRLLVGTTSTTTSSSQSGEVYSTGAVGFLMTNTTAGNYALSVKNEGTTSTRNLINFYEGTGGGTSRANISFDTSNNLAFTTTNYATFTGSGVGIGTSSPSKKLHISASGSACGIRIDNTVSGRPVAITYDDSQNLTLTNSSDTGYFAYVNGTGSGTERMRISSDGGVFIGCTTRPTSATGGACFSVQSNNRRYLELATTTTSSTALQEFINGNGTVGSISVSGSATTYSTSSDYRLKENIAPMVGALDVVQQLKPVTYNWKADGSDGQGFIAHELQAVVPECVTGEKDAVDAEGNPVYQGIDTSFLVATLTAAIQEQQALITQLQADVAALKGAK